MTRRSWVAAISQSPLATALAAQNKSSAPAPERRNASNASPELYRAISAFWEPHDREMIQWLGNPGRHVLDLGCGRGDHTLLFAERTHTTAFDLREASLDFLRRRAEAAGLSKNITVKQGDLFRIPFETNSFDLVWSSHVFHGLSNLEDAARAVKRVLRPGGRFVIRENRVTATLLPDDLGIGEPGFESRTNRAFETWLRKDREKRGRYPHGWAHLLHAAGFREVETRSFLHQVSPPFNQPQQQYLTYWLDRKREIEGISPQDVAILNQLMDRGAPAYFLRRDDLSFVSVSSLFIGKV